MAKLNTDSASDAIEAMGFKPFTWSDDSTDGPIVRVSAEENDGAADYYAPADIAIDAQLVALADDNGAFWEWHDTGSLALYFN